MMTQKELAAASGVGIATISRIEAGRVNASLRTIRVLAEVFNMSPRELREILSTQQARLL
jgi:transcriptional regulator with XRE-family HTH domain